MNASSFLRSAHLPGAEQSSRDEDRTHADFADANLFSSVTSDDKSPTSGSIPYERAATSQPDVFESISEQGVQEIPPRVPQHVVNQRPAAKLMRGQLA